MSQLWLWWQSSCGFYSNETCCLSVVSQALSQETYCNLPSLSTWRTTMVVGLYRMLKRIRCDGSCARDSQLLTHNCCGHDITLPVPLLLDEIIADLACKLHYQPLTCWTRFLPTCPVSYTTSHSAVERGSCGPDLRATLLASRLLNEFLVDLTCELRYQPVSCSCSTATRNGVIRHGWDLEVTDGQ